MRSQRIALAALPALFAAALPAGAQEPAPVALARPEAARSTRTLELPGSFVARRSARLSPRMPGLVAEAPVDAGDRVSAGDLMLRLDPRLAELAVAQAEAVREESRARLAEAERLLAEAQRLARDRFVPETEIAARRSEVAIAEASLAIAEADLATARERLARHAVQAPFDGVVAQRFAEVGEWVETGTAVAQLVGLDGLWLEARVPQEYFASLAGDVAARVRVDAVGDRELTARVHARVPVSDPTARTFLLRLVLDEAPPSVVTGMSATVYFTWVSGEEVLYVPRDAVIRLPDGTTTVWVVDEAEGQATAHEIEIEIARYEGDRAEVRSGLTPDRPVVVRGNEVLTEGQRVRIVGRS